WEMWLEAAGVSGVDPARGSHFSHASLALAAAVDGLGVALNLSVLAAEHVAAGHLVIPFDPGIPLTSAYYLLTPEAKETDPNLAAFREWLLKEARAHEAICPAPKLLAVSNVKDHPAADFRSSWGKRSLFVDSQRIDRRARRGTMRRYRVQYSL
ncbi:MAG TPA: LysR substrate-binding domain-containing protein, partial [Burkholderiales bacterium]|nr:LysR substrate-binding domain-containing protein [Burkholderiales bacterium]